PLGPHDLDEPYLPRAVGVRPPARLDVPVSDVDDPEGPGRDDSPLEEPEPVLGLCLFPREPRDLDRVVLHHDVVRDVLDLPHLVIGQLGEVGDVETPVVLLFERRVLPDPRAKDLPGGPVDDVGSGVDAPDLLAPPRVDLPDDLGALPRGEALDLVDDDPSDLLDVDDPSVGYRPVVRLLPATPGVEGGLVEDHVASRERL